MTIHRGIRHVLLDIEGTTCPVTYVGEVLFPYARRQLRPFLEEHGDEPVVQDLLRKVQTELDKDTTSKAAELRRAPGASAATGNRDRLCQYLDLLMQADRKVTVLKDLQGMIWEEGYQRGVLITPLFSDVPGALREWQAQGLQLSVYSSGSIHAQKLLYAHTEWGDLTSLFTQWFDTHTGNKTDPRSYGRIATSLAASGQEILFISDAIKEIEAAAKAGMATVFSLRPGNPQSDPKEFPVLASFEELQLNPTTPTEPATLEPG